MTDRAELAAALEYVTAEKSAAQHELYAAQERLRQLSKAADGLQALLELELPAPVLRDAQGSGQ